MATMMLRLFAAPLAGLAMSLGATVQPAALGIWIASGRTERVR